MDTLTPPTLPIRNNRIRLTHGTLFWREVGYGETVLLLHGSWQDSAQWIPLMSALSTFVHCLAPDLLGFGESSQPSAPGSVDGQVAALTEYLEKVRAYPKAIVADGLGAWVALRYCLHHPESVQRLVLLAPEGIYSSDRDRDWYRWRWLARSWDPRTWCVNWLAPILRILKGDRWLMQARERRNQFRHHRTTCHLLFKRRKTAIQAESLNEVLGDIPLPTFLLQPERLSEEQQRLLTRVQQAMPQVQIISIPVEESAVWTLPTQAENRGGWQRLRDIIITANQHPFGTP